MTIIDGDTDLSKFKLKYYSNDNQSASITATINLTNVTNYTYSADLKNYTPEGSHVSWTIKLFKTNTSNEESLCSTAYAESYVPYPIVTNFEAWSDYAEGDYDESSVSNIRITLDSTYSYTYHVWRAYRYINKNTGKSYRVPSSGYTLISACLTT
jgi:hypothetical protein